MAVLTEKRVLVIGGSSGIGLATAKAVLQEGARVVIAGRSQEKFQQAQQQLGTVEIQSLNVLQEEALQQYGKQAGKFDHLVVAGSAVYSGPFRELETKYARATMDSKFWGAYLAAKYIEVAPEGSITLFSGVFADRPPVGYAVVAATNGALEALCRALAVELAPVRVNVISPGIVETPIYSAMAPEMRQNYFQSVASNLPVKRIGKPEDIAEGVILLMRNGYTTGTTLVMDGGGLVV